MYYFLDVENIKYAKVTLFLIFINVFCYITFNLVLTDDFIHFIQINRNIIEDHEIWRIFTPIFIHIDFIHLFSNMIGLLLFGATIENSRVYSKIEYVFIYFVSGLIGNLFSLILLPLDSISLGASGAIFGLIGATFVMIVTEDRSLLLLALMYILFFIVSSLAPEINLWAHLFGLLGGVFLGYIFKPKDTDLEHY
ncbi:MAG: rhomboid family intramembrane serine protease [Candidatus Hodarchaeota archaeon]